MKKNIIAQKWLCYVVLFLICGCTSEKEVEIPGHIEKLDNLTVYPADVSPERQIELIREQVFGSTDELLLGRLGSVGVDTSGRVFIGDIDKKIFICFHLREVTLPSLGEKGVDLENFGHFILWVLIRINYMYMTGFIEG